MHNLVPIEIVCCNNNNTTNSTISERYKHLTIVKAYTARQHHGESAIFGCGQFRTFSPGFRFGQRYHVDRHGQLTLKQLRLSVLNEMHTNSYSGPRLAGQHHLRLFLFLILISCRVAVAATPTFNRRWKVTFLGSMSFSLVTFT